MTDRALQLKVNLNGPMTHYMAGAETSTMRIFDMASTTASGNEEDGGAVGVTGTLKAPRRQGGASGENSNGLEGFLNEQDKGRMSATFLGSRYALAGTSDGQLLAFDLKGEDGDQLALLASSSQLCVSAITSVDLPSVAGGADRCLVFLLLEDGSLSVVELSTMGSSNSTDSKSKKNSFFGNAAGASSTGGVFTRLLVDSHQLGGTGGRIQNPSAVAAALMTTTEGAGSDVQIRLLCCGVSSGVYQYVHSANNSSTTTANFEKVCHFSCGAVQHAWLSSVSGTDGAPQSQMAVLADATSGTLRLYNVATEEKGITRARLSMSCGQRVVSLNVSEATTGSAGSVVATTFTGQVFVWTLANLRPETVVQLATPPSAELVSQHPRGRLIGGGFSRATATQTDNKQQQLILVRGSFAAPIFEAFEWAHLKDCYKHSTRIGGGGHFSSTGRRVAYHVPFDISLGRGATNGELAQFRSTHGKVGKIVPTISGALGGVEFQEPELHQAKSMKDLPALRGGASMNEEDLEGDHQLAGGFSNQARAALGATTGLAVPLYQALHARDDGQVLELMSVAGRSDEDLAATISQLDVANLVHLLHVITKRLKTVGARHPLHQWVRVVLICKGVFLSNHAKVEQQENTSRKENDGEEVSSAPTSSSSVAAVMAPLLFQYQGYLEMRDRLCHCYGRLGTFHGVRPKREKTTVALGDERKGGKKGGKSSDVTKDVVDTRLYKHVFLHSYVEGHNGHLKEVMLPDDSEEGRMQRKRSRIEGLEMLGDEFDDEMGDFDGADPEDDDSEGGDMLEAALGDDEEDVDHLAARAAEEEDDLDDMEGFGDEGEEEEDEEEEEEEDRAPGYDDEEGEDSDDDEEGDAVPTERRDERVLRRAGKRDAQNSELKLDDF